MTFCEPYRARGREDDISSCARKTLQWEKRGHPLVSTEVAIKKQRRRHPDASRFKHRKYSQHNQMEKPSPPHKYQMKENYLNNIVISSTDMRKELTLILIMG